MAQRVAAVVAAGLAKPFHGSAIGRLLDDDVEVVERPHRQRSQQGFLVREPVVDAHGRDIGFMGDGANRDTGRPVAIQHGLGRV